MSLGRSVLKLVTSRIASWTILLVASPIIARMFTPADFGDQQIFRSIMRVFMVVVCLRYELSIPLGRDDREANASFVLSAMICLLFSLALLAIVPFTRNQMAMWFDSPYLGTFLWFLPLGLFIGGFQNALQYWVTYKMRFGIMAWAGFVSAGVKVLTPIGWYLVYGRSPAGLLAGIFTSGVVVILIFLTPLLQVPMVELKAGGFGSIISVAKYHKKFPSFSILSGLANVVSVELLPIILSLHFPKSVVGYYSLGNRLIRLPVSMLCGSIGQVFFPIAAKEYNKTGDISKVVSSVFKRLVQISVFPMLVLVFLSPTFFTFLLGKEWTEAGVYTQILAVWFLLVCISSPLGNVFYIVNRQGTRLMLDIWSVLGRTTSLLIGAAILSPRGTLSIYVAFSTLVMVVFIILILRFSKVSVLWAAKTMLRYVVLSCILLLPVKSISWIAGYWTVTLCTVLATILYTIALFRIDSSFGKFISQRLSGLRR